MTKDATKLLEDGMRKLEQIQEIIDNTARSLNELQSQCKSASDSVTLDNVYELEAKLVKLFGRQFFVKIDYATELSNSGVKLNRLDSYPFLDSWLAVLGFSRSHISRCIVSKKPTMEKVLTFSDVEIKEWLSTFEIPLYLVNRMLRGIESLRTFLKMRCSSDRGLNFASLHWTIPGDVPHFSSFATEWLNLADLSRDDADNNNDGIVSEPSSLSVGFPKTSSNNYSPNTSAHSINTKPNHMSISSNDSSSPMSFRSATKSGTPSDSENEQVAPKIQHRHSDCSPRNTNVQYNSEKKKESSDSVTSSSDLGIGEILIRGGSDLSGSQSSDYAVHHHSDLQSPLSPSDYFSDISSSVYLESSANTATVSVRESTDGRQVGGTVAARTISTSVGDYNKLDSNSSVPTLVLYDRQDPFSQHRGSSSSPSIAQRRRGTKNNPNVLPMYHLNDLDTLNSIISSDTRLSPHPQSHQYSNNAIPNLMTLSGDYSILSSRKNRVTADTINSVSAVRYPLCKPPLTPPARVANLSEVSGFFGIFSGVKGKSSERKSSAKSTSGGRPGTPPPRIKNTLLQPEQLGFSLGSISKSKSIESGLSNRITQPTDNSTTVSPSHSSKTAATTATASPFISHHHSYNYPHKISHPNMTQRNESSVSLTNVPIRPRIVSEGGFNLESKSVGHSHNLEHSNSLPRANSLLVETPIRAFSPNEQLSQNQYVVQNLKSSGQFPSADSPSTYRMEHRVAHRIEHRFSHKKMIMAYCDYCKKFIVRGKVCKHCKNKYHRGCAIVVARTPSCGLSEQHLKSLKEFMSIPISTENMAANFCDVPTGAFYYNSSGSASNNSSNPSSPAHPLNTSFHGVNRSYSHSIHTTPVIDGHSQNSAMDAINDSVKNYFNQQIQTTRAGGVYPLPSPLIKINDGVFFPPDGVPPNSGSSTSGFESGLDGGGSLYNTSGGNSGNECDDNSDRIRSHDSDKTVVGSGSISFVNVIDNFEGTIVSSDLGYVSVNQQSLFQQGSDHSDSQRTYNNDPGVDDDTESEHLSRQQSLQSEDGDEFDDGFAVVPSVFTTRRRRKQNVTYSMVLKEWDIPFESLEFDYKEDLVGEGRFATVYRGKWHGECCIKLLKSSPEDDDTTMAAVRLSIFKMEVSQLRKVRHDHLVLFMGACMRPPNLCVVTGLCKGPSLSKSLHTFKDRYPLNKATVIASQIATGMAYLHSRDLLHKDLTSRNVFLEYGKAVLADYGIINMTFRCSSKDELMIPRRWLCYLSPEIVRELRPLGDDDEFDWFQSLPFSRASDVYSFGALFYELLTSECPYDRVSPIHAMFWQVGTGVRPQMNHLNIIKEAKDLVMLCMAYDAGDRPPFTIILDKIMSLPKGKRLGRSPSHPVQMSRSTENMHL